jgi:hypothetical protein
VNKPDRVALSVQKPGERRGERAGVIRFCVTNRAVAHRAALIHKQMAAEIGFILEFFQVVTVRARIQTPVEIARVVAGRVLAVFRELDRETVIRTAMQTVPKSFTTTRARSSRLRIAINAFASTKPSPRRGGDEIVGDEAGMF